MKSNHPSGRRQRSERAPEGAILHPVDWVVESGAVDDVLHEMKGRLRQGRRRRLHALTAGMAALLVAGFIWHQAGRRGERSTAHPAPSAVVSLPERQVLGDGSVIELRNGAQVTAAFTDAVRRVVLVRGEAHFQVTKNTRPFVVAVGDVEVRAVGTAFSVQRGAREVEVLVTEGRVRVEQALSESPAALPAHSPALNLERNVVAVVDAGNRVLVPAEAAVAAAAAPAVVPVESAELAERLAWRAPRLEFSRTPLAEAIEMMNHHAASGKHTTVILADPSLRRVQVSGILRADNMDTLVRLLEEEYGIRAERRRPDEIVLRLRP